MSSARFRQCKLVSSSVQSGVRDPEPTPLTRSLSFSDYAHLNLCLAHQKYSSVVVLTWVRLRFRREVAQETSLLVPIAHVSEQHRSPHTSAALRCWGRLCHLHGSALVTVPQAGFNGSTIQTLSFNNSHGKRTLHQWSVQ